MQELSIKHEVKWACAAEVNKNSVLLRFGVGLVTHLPFYSTTLSQKNIHLHSFANGSLTEF